MGEEHVIGLLEQTHAADSALGTLGAINGAAIAVKDFGRMIVREHHALRRDALGLASGLRLAPQTPRVSPDEPPADLRANLNVARLGDGWDRLYIDYAIAVHESAMENSARALAATNSPATKEFIIKSVPILQKHLDKALSLRKSLSETPDTTRTAKP